MRRRWTLLLRSDQINKTQLQGSHPADLAFLAMTQQQLGHAKEAQAELQRLRERMKDPRLAAECRSAGLPARSGSAAGKTQDARQQVNTVEIL